MFFRFVSSYFIKPQFFVGFSLALDKYCDDSPLNCLKYAEVIDVILRGIKLIIHLFYLVCLVFLNLILKMVILGMTSTRLTGRELEGWIDEPWAKKGESRTVFFQRVITRFCPDFIGPILERATQKFITVGYDFWSDPGVTNSIYRAFSTLLAFDWSTVGLIASQNSTFVQRLNRQSRHEFFRAKKFLEHFTEFCEYRNLRLKINSERLDVSENFSQIMFYLSLYSGYIPIYNI